MQFPRFQTPSVFLKEYFRNNPEQLRSYLQLGTTAARLAIGPIGLVLKHLIEIQGIDPKTEPGRKMREAFQTALNATFQKHHDHDFDQDFDFSWLNKKFEQTRKDIEGLNLTKEDYRKMTDVGHLRATQALDVDQQSNKFSRTTLRADVQSGVPVTIDQTPVEELADLLGVNPVNQIAPEPVEQARDVFNDESWLKLHAAVHSNPSTLELPRDRKELQDALQRLVEVAKDLEEDNAVDPTELMARTKELKNLKETLKQYSTPSRPLKKPGKVHRAQTGKTDAVKPTPKTRTTRPVKKASTSKGVFRRVTR